MPNRILALDLSGNRFAAVVVENSFRGRTFLAHAVETRDPARGLAEQLREFLSRHRLHGDTVLTALSGVSAVYRVLELPFRDRRKLAQTVPFEIETQVPVPLEEGIVDFQVLGRVGESTRLLAALAPRRRIEEHLALLAEAGIDPAVVDFAPLAAMNVVRFLETDDARPFALLAVGTDEASVGLWQDGSLHALRVVDRVPGETATTLAGDVLWSLSSFKDAAGETLLDSTARLPIHLCGDLPAGLVEALRENGGADVRLLADLGVRELPDAVRRRLGDLATAVGMVAARVGDDGALGVDFRREEFAYQRRDQELRGALGRLGALAAVVVVLFAFAQIFSYVQLSRRYEEARGRVREVFEQALPGVPVVDEVSQLREKIGELERRRDQLGGPTAILDALREISVRSPTDPRMFVEELSFDGPTLLLRAKTASFEAVETIKKALAESPILRDIQVRDPRTTPDGSVEFRLSIALGSGSGAG